MLTVELKIYGCLIRIYVSGHLVTLAEYVINLDAWKLVCFV